MLEGLSLLSENAPHRRSHTLHVEQLPATKPHSAQVASRAAAQTGLSADVLKRMLPLAATLMMGTFSKQSAAS